MSTQPSKTLVSGVKPSGTLHLGNYFGAMKQFVDLQQEYDARIFIADYHALTGAPDPRELSEATWNIAVAYLAIGLDPENTRIYKQSDVPSHTELTTILSNIVPSSYLFRAHAYKDAEQKDEEVNAGTLNYPVLMAADIIMYDAHVVPVGEDQKQHLEYTRDFVQRFNHRYGELFREPQELILDEVKTTPGTDGRKMSKSYDNIIPLFATDEEIREAVMSIPTDSQPVEQPKENYEEDIVYQLHTLVTPEDELERITDGYKNGGLSYKESKEKLIESVSTFIRPLREKRDEIANNPDYVFSVLDAGARAARAEATEKMNKVRSAVGLDITTHT